MSSRVENALEECREKYVDKRGRYELEISECRQLAYNGDRIDAAMDGYNFGFVMGIKYAEEMRKALK
ncbi:MAG: hypothetical protein HFE72_06465 [Emergencia sp.]|nr:hypothetical protein [Emergencia sp.]